MKYEKLAVRLCSVLQRQLTNQIHGHSRVMLEWSFDSQLIFCFYIKQSSQTVQIIYVNVTNIEKKGTDYKTTITSRAGSVV